MIVIPKPGKFLFGSPDYEVGHRREEELDEREINYTYAISAHEVTYEQFERFKADHMAMEPAHERDCPATFVTWYSAARYCRWLSEEEGIPEAERNYPRADELRAPVREALPKGYLFRKGYRLPTVEEWEYAARSGSATARFFGNATADLDRYAWWANNSDERVQPVGRLRPSPIGLFDIYGNANEWCELVPSPANETYAGLRGGGYRSTAGFVRSAMPEWTNLGQSLSYIGFRIVRVSPEP
jgi:formylglycine-generating enzyme required for sulfatase activity